MFFHWGRWGICFFDTSLVRILQVRIPKLLQALYER